MHSYATYTHTSNHPIAKLSSCDDRREEGAWMFPDL